MSDLDGFLNFVEKCQLSDVQIATEEAVMDILNVGLYEPGARIGDVENILAKYSLSDFEIALDHALYYESDDVIDDPFEIHNLGNMMLEINRMAHLKQVLQGMKPKRKKKFF